MDEVDEPGGVRGPREVVRQRGSVAALPVHDDGRVVLVRQYRYAVDALVWELPAGRRDPGETPEEGARRELEEEVGLRAACARAAPRLLDDARASATRSCTCSAPPASSPSRRAPRRTRGSSRATFTLDEALAMVRRGEIREGKTLVALLLEARRRERARREPGPAGSSNGTVMSAPDENDQNSRPARSAGGFRAAPEAPRAASVVVLEARGA